MGRYSRVIRSVEDMHRAGCMLGQQLRKGDVLLFYGLYGVGKTEFIRGVVQGFLLDTAVSETVASPSFTGLHVYQGSSGRICHYDLYRFDQVTPEVFYDAEEEDLLCIEWAEKVPSTMFRCAIMVEIRIVNHSHREVIVNDVREGLETEL